jgi:small subunit ribosomal protein S3
MGQKVNPISFRLQVHKNWDSRWFAGKKDFAKWLAEDIKIRDLIEKNLVHDQRLIVSKLSEALT